MEIEDRQFQQRILKADVQNPKPDRRCKDLLSAPVIPAGTKIEVKTWTEIVESLNVKYPVGEISIHPDSRQTHQDRWASVNKRHRGVFYERLMEASEPVGESMADWARTNDIYYKEVLVRLLEKGRLTKGDVEAAQQELMDEWAAKDR